MNLILTALLACAAPAAAQVNVSTPPATVDDAYHPSNGRDPMVASTIYGDLTGRGSLPVKGGKQSAVVAESTFSVYALSLVGVMEDSGGRQALLKDAAGNIYILRGGRLIDSRKKAVRGVSGVIKGKQVTLMTEDKKVCHLNMRENQ